MATRVESEGYECNRRDAETPRHAPRKYSCISLGVFLGALGVSAVAFCFCLFTTSAFAEPLPKLILLTQSKGFVHDVVKHPDGGPSVVQKTFASIAEKSKLFELEMTEDASILTPEKLKDTRIVVFYTTGDLPMDLKVFDQWIRDG